tara:strand:+ start:116 stop:394 length:279 start_codon:yes stop_codon:yes gene_type:complete
MADKIISVRLDENLYRQLKLRDEVNWSAVIRNALLNRVKTERSSVNFDRHIASNAKVAIENIRDSRVFDSKVDSTQIIREWRDKEGSILDGN